MTNLLTEPLPDNVTIHRRRYKINTDFRLMVRLEWLLTEEPESDERDNALLSLFCELLPDIERLSRTVPAAEITEAVLSFYRHGQPPEQPDGEDGEQESGNGETATADTTETAETATTESPEKAETTETAKTAETTAAEST